MLNATIKSIVMCVIILSDVMLYVIMLNVVWMCFFATYKWPE